MVGIPRSKGCKTCKRKKIKCDEARPSCGQCQKGSRECEGYERATIFLNSSTGDYDPQPSSGKGGGIRFKNQFAKDIAWQNSHEYNSNSEISSKPDKAVVVARPSKKSSFRAQPYVAGPKGRMTGNLAGNSSSISMSNYKPPAPRALDTQVWAVENILAQFLQICVPPSSTTTQETPLAWIQSLVPMKKEVDALPLAMSALAFGWAGHVHNQPQLVDKGLQLYNAAVQQLRADLDTCSPVQMLAVTALFIEFELCEFGSRGNPGWQTHMRGIAALLRAFGPDMVSTQPFLQIYSFCRMIFITRGLTQRRRICAGSPMWRLQPFKNHKKNAYHKFYDLASEACEMLERADALELPDIDPAGESDSPADVFADIVNLIQRLKKLQRDEQMSTTVIGPASFPDASSAAHNRLLRATARGYPVRIPEGQSQWTYDAIQGQRLIHTFWALLLDLCMTILENCHLRLLLENDSEEGGLQDQFLAALGIVRSTKSDDDAARLVAEECRKLANDVAIYATLACHNMCQSFGSLISFSNLEAAVRWYESHPGGPTEAALEEHCRAVLRGIKDEEAKEPCAFDVTILPEDVLRCKWC
ncbi:hypothetical protein F5Y16DRAFT_92752 [Xylariaceae sp. FL0255]|nr:hypothetical protein F5Y16DRAFT_92752 [Xylariaceae sp. FL0255]